jgi:hypothetical protein
MLDFAAKAARLWKGYHQIPVNPEDVKKAAISTLSGLYKKKRMPFGIMNAGASSQWHRVDWAIIKCEGQPLSVWKTSSSAEPRSSM